MVFKKRLVTALAVLPLALAACSGTSTSGSNASAAAAKSGGGGGGGGGQGHYGYHFAVITHGSPGDSFWSVVKNGAEAAGKDLGDTVEYQSDGDPQKQSQLIDAAVNQKVDGLVVSMANPDALKTSIENAVKAGIPVITINSGEAESAQFGALTHVGQDEEVAGQGAGKKLKEAGVTKIICVIHEAGNVGLEQRCKGAADVLGSSNVENLQVDINNLQAAESTIKAKLQSDSSVNGVLTLNPSVATVAVQAVQEAGSKVKLATFDLSPDVISDIKSGKILFGVDQQQYLQGYLPIVFLTLYKANANVVGGGQPVLTGPGFVTKANADRVAQLTKQGTR